jgi:predicted transcriptional regulator
MSAVTVPISDATHRKLQELSAQTGQTTEEVVDRALEAYHRQVFFEQLNAGYAALRADRAASAELDADQRAWDATLADGLDPDERWSADGRCLTPEPDEA